MAFKFSIASRHLTTSGVPRSILTFVLHTFKLRNSDDIHSRQDLRLSGSVAFTDSSVNAPVASIITTDASSAMNAAALEGIAEARNILDSATRKSAILNALAQLIGNNATNPIDYREIDWSNEPLSRG